MSTRLLVLFLLLLLITPASRALAQPQQGLPPGILGIEIDGQPVDAQNSPTTNSSTPEISGRADATVSTLELALVSDNTVRFQATIAGSGRFRAVPPQELPDAVYSLYANDNLVGIFTIVDGSPGPRSPGALLDIARVVPYPIDAAQALPDLAFLDGQFLNLSEEAARTAARGVGGSTARELERQLAMAGWLQRYENRLAVPNAENPRAFDVQITSFVVEYASGADARAAFDSLKSANAADFPTIGDESQLTTLSGTTSDTGAAYQAARLSFRVGPLLVVITYADLRDQPPDLAVLQSIGTIVAERGGLVADRQVVPLGSMALKLDLEGAGPDVAVRALYENRAGTLTAVFGEAQDARDYRAARLAGTTDAFTISATGNFTRTASNRSARQTGDASPEPEVPVLASPVSDLPQAEVDFETSLVAFTSESEADAWMAEQENVLETTSGALTTFERVSDAPALADAAAVFATRTVREDGSELTGYRVFARSGTIVAVVDVESAPAVSLRGAVGLVEEQLACISAQGCTGSASLPGSIFGSRDRPSN